MMSFWARTLVYLGLREESDDQVDWKAMDATDAEMVVQGGGTSADVSVQRVGASAARPHVTEVSNVRPLRGGLDVSSERVAVVQVQTFDDVQAIGSRFRLRHAVLFDVSGCSREVARRVVDFVSGLTFASRGSLRRTAKRAFILIPEGVDIPLDERRRLAQLGYDVDGVTR
jgi:FtsZ-interacting cell division protein YlmF